MDNLVTSGYVIIVFDKNEKDLCDTLKERYIGNSWVDVISSDKSYDLDESKIYIY